MMSQCLWQVMVLQVEMLSTRRFFYVIFFVCFHGSRLHRRTFPFGLACRDFWCNNFYTKRVQSCSCALACQLSTTRPLELHQGCSSLSNWSGSADRDVQLIAPFPVVFFATSQAMLQSTFERCSGFPPSSLLLTLRWFCCLQKSQGPGSWLLFPEPLSLEHPRNIALGSNIKLKH